MARLQKDKIEFLDVVILIGLTIFALMIVLPFYNVIVVSFTSQKEYMEKAFVLFPTKPTLSSYQTLFKDGRILIGYKTTLLLLALGLPLNMFLTTSMAYALSQKNLPGKKPILKAVFFTMLFDGGIIAMYLVMMSMKLTNTIWSVVLVYGVNTFYFIVMRNYFMSLPESLTESARLDGAGEWRIIWQIILPISKPIISTVALFYSVDRWNEWFHAMIFIRKTNLVPLQLVLRSIVIDSMLLLEIGHGAVGLKEQTFSMGVKMGAVLVTMIPVMCVFPFLQKHFVKGVMVGAIKA